MISGSDLTSGSLIDFPDFFCLLLELELQEVVEDEVDIFRSRFFEPELGVLFL